MDEFHGSANITGEGIKKHFKSIDPLQGLNELVWNGFDARAKTIDVRIAHNNMDGLDSIYVIDDGEGIDVENLKNSFGKFNESQKKGDDDKHGSQGKGRLAFYKLSEVAVWYTKRKEYNAKITIKSDDIKNYKGEYLDENRQHVSLMNLKSGTCVELRNFNNVNIQNTQVVVDSFSQEFGWFLVLNTEAELRVNGEVVPVPGHDLVEKSFVVEGHGFEAKVIRWEERPGSEKSFNYLINSQSKVVQKRLSKFNNKGSFYTSAYVLSKWVDEYDPDGLELGESFRESQKIEKAVQAQLTLIQKEIYKSYLRRYVDQEIERYDREGYFPNYNKFESEYGEFRKRNTKKILKDIYLSDPTIFNKLNEKPTKILIRLLDKVLVSNENDSLFEVLDGVLNLDPEELSKFASQLRKTTMENIISTIESLQKRQVAIQQLREIMDVRFGEVLETPDLQKVIENNTWLFGPQYSILGAEEASFTRIAQSLRDKVANIDVVSDQDVFEGLEVEGVNRQVDLFLARKVPSFNSENKEIYKCVVVEIKRPGVSLNKRHLQQLDDYTEVISKHPAFGSNKMKFELILVGRKISRDDFQINQRMSNLKDKAEFGLVTCNDKIKCYVKDWYTIFDEFDLSNNYLLNTLNTKFDELSDVSTNEMLGELNGAGKGVH